MTKWWTKISTKGLHLPFMHDSVSGKPSVTLLFCYITFVLALVSVILLHIKASMFLATSTSLFFWIVSVVFYRLRKLDKFKMDLDNKTIELEGEEE